MSCFSPAKMLSDPTQCKKSFETCLKSPVNVGRADVERCDATIRVYSSFLDSAFTQSSGVMATFNQKTDRLDSLFHGLLHGKQEYQWLWSTVKMLLALSHGQATVERGFSINKEALADNQKALSLIARRTVLDFIHHAGGVLKVSITKELLSAAAGARTKYRLYLEEEKARKDEAAKSQKRKAEEEEKEKLITKRARLCEGVKQLLISADQSAEKAEKEGNLSQLTVSNISRRGAKEKQKEIDKLDKQIRDLDNPKA